MSAARSLELHATDDELQARPVNDATASDRACMDAQARRDRADEIARIAKAHRWSDSTLAAVLDCYRSEAGRIRNGGRASATQLMKARVQAGRQLKLPGVQ